LLYQRGLGVTADRSEAENWFRRAAMAGNARAMYAVAEILLSREGRDPDYKEAVNWIRKSAQLGLKDSQYDLGALYARGQGVPVDLEEAYVWFDAAAVAGDEDARHAREEIARRLTPNTLGRARRTAEAFRARSAERQTNEPVLLTRAEK
jgi:localization factor PodJL